MQSRKPSLNTHVSTLSSCACRLRPGEGLYHARLHAEAWKPVPDPVAAPLLLSLPQPCGVDGWGRVTGKLTRTVQTFASFTPHATKKAFTPKVTKGGGVACLLHTHHICCDSHSSRAGSVAPVDFQSNSVLKRIKIPIWCEPGFWVTVHVHVCLS